VLLRLFYANSRCGARRRNDTVAVIADFSGIEGEQSMVEQVIRLAVSLTVHDGKLEEFQEVAASLTAGSKEEPGTIGYEWFAHPDGKQFYLLETYTDAAAVDAHFTGPVVQQGVPKLTAVCNVDRFEVFGDPDPKVREMAAGMGAVFFSYSMGLDR
jgi:quinol monooxygenase YgiN